MRFKIIAVGTRMPSWVEEGFREYAKRLPRDFSVEMVELPIGPRGKNASLAKAIAKEGEQMMAAIPKGDKVIALEVLGKPWSTEKLASNLANWSMENNNYSILIGGPVYPRRDNKYYPPKNIEKPIRLFPRTRHSQWRGVYMFSGSVI